MELSEISILSKNEQTFFEKYGLFLSEKWNALSEDERINALEMFLGKIESMTFPVLNFDEDIILRIVVGCGDGYGIRGIIDNALPTLRALVWEPDEAAFLACCCYSDMSALFEDKRLTFIIGRDRDELELAIRMNLFDSNYRHNRILAQEIYARIDNGDVRFLTDTINRIAEEVSLGGRIGSFFDIHPCENMLQAFYLLNENYVAGQLFRAIPVRDIPVIIVSAGPSLMKNCADLKRVRNRAIIIAVAHAMRTVFQHGVIPDMVAFSDAHRFDYMDFDSESRYMLLSSVFSDRALQQKYNGNIVYHGFELAEQFFSCQRAQAEPPARLNTGSVATDVFSLFISAGFKRIILVGQDLAYASDGNSHTDWESEYGTYERNGLQCFVDGISGKKVKTRKDWEDFRRVFESIIKEHKDVHVIDATEGGALIHGTEIMTLKNAIDRYCIKDYPVDLWFRNMIKGSEDEKEYIQQWFDDQIWDIERMRRYLDEVIALNSTVREGWEKTDEWDSDFSSKCRKYDVLFNQIVYGDAGELLRFYCTKEMHEYFEDAMTVEGDDNILKRMQLELKLFTLLRQKSEILLVYINKLIDNDRIG